MKTNKIGALAPTISNYLQFGRADNLSCGRAFGSKFGAQKILSRV